MWSDLNPVSSLRADTITSGFESHSLQMLEIMLMCRPVVTQYRQKQKDELTNVLT